MATPELLLQALGCRFEQHRVGIRSDREAIVVIGDAERPVGVLEAELAILEYLAVLVAERWHNELHQIAGLRPGWPPVDVEEHRVARGRSILEDVEPPIVTRITD